MPRQPVKRQRNGCYLHREAPPRATSHLTLVSVQGKRREVSRLDGSGGVWFFFFFTALQASKATDPIGNHLKKKPTHYD